MKDLARHLRFVVPQGKQESYSSRKLLCRNKYGRLQYHFLFENVFDGLDFFLIDNPGRREGLFAGHSQDMRNINLKNVMFVF